MDIFKNDDQVATIIAHELSHVVMEHSSEILSLACLLDLLILPSMISLHAYVPRFLVALLMQWVVNVVVSLTVKFPERRKAESESDMVGLYLAARACFDVREACSFYQMLSETEGLRDLE
ncbi:hypothetical protein Pmani_019547 [Petrolisthes manimaculis]|uniref:Metalloendopeptidase OMA1, mitochondrial n=1 Tax=Petrolisthes manimaculis TaxID=1843537 RepID=A0AAE1NBI3_9EUCA|nr:hypothetical protein Pmani_039957 [Petrolisthes manimaculis]KAK4308791.1 hypothetical protein Pmani_019547 [Petrolisthes manimaculis]